MLRLILAAVSLAAGPGLAEGIKFPQIGNAKTSGLHLPQIGAIAADDKPMAIVEQYLLAMAEGNSSADLPLYSSASRLALQLRRVSDNQMANVARAYEKCGTPDVLVLRSLAVVRYRIEERKCAPFLLFRENNTWVLDFVMAAASLRFSENDEWHFGDQIPRAYEFGFVDWTIDENGFPIAAQSDNAATSTGDPGAY